MQTDKIKKLKLENLSSADRFDIKRKIMIEWLIETRYTSLDIAMALMGLQSRGSRLFIERMLESNAIVPFKNIMLSKRDLVRLGTAGLKLLCDDSIPRTHTKSKPFTEKASLPHDLGVQKCILDALENFYGSSEIKIQYDRSHDYFKSVQPDALLFFEDENLPTAIEYERQGKSNIRQFFLFQRYKHLIMDSQVYERVVFYFHDETVMAEYQRNFDKKNWPIVEKKEGRYRLSGLSSDQSEGSGFRSWFKFRLMPVHSKPTLVKSIYGSSGALRSPSQYELWITKEATEQLEQSDQGIEDAQDGSVDFD